METEPTPTCDADAAYHTWLKSLPLEQWFVKTVAIVDRATGAPISREKEGFIPGHNMRNCPHCASSILKKVG